MITLEIGDDSEFGNGRTYGNFTSVSVDKSLDNFVGQFSFNASSTPGQQKNFPIKAGQSCIVLVDDNPVLSGYIEVVSGAYDKQSHYISIQGRDKTADLIDSTLGGNFGKNTQTISLIQFTKEVLKQQNIENVDVVSNVDIPDFKPGEILDSETGDTVFAYIERYSRKRQVLMTTDKDSNIVFQQSSGETDPDLFLLNEVNNNQNNIISASWTNDFSQLYNEYVVRSQANFGALDSIGFPSADEAVASVSNKAIDSLIRRSRILNIVAESSSNSDQCQERALWQRNMARTNSFGYSAVVQGHSKPNGEAFTLNRLVRIKDVFADIDGEYLLNYINWEISNDDGSLTTLGFVNKDAYTLEIADPSEIEKSRPNDAFLDIPLLDL